jgi:hypothetical protein
MNFSSNTFYNLVVTSLGGASTPTQLLVFLVNGVFFF